MEGASGPRRTAPLLGAKVAAAIAVHLLALLVLERTAARALGELLPVPLPTGDGLPAALAGWARLSAVPLAAWAALVLGRVLVLRRDDSRFWFVSAALLVATAMFPLALVQWIVASGEAAVATVLAAWLIAPCAAAVAVVAHPLRRARRTP